jgi:hypothetical protein
MFAGSADLNEAAVGFRVRSGPAADQRLFHPNLLAAQRARSGFDKESLRGMTGSRRVGSHPGMPNAAASSEWRLFEARYGTRPFEGCFVRTMKVSSISHE